jgi:hypothetical protein
MLAGLLSRRTSECASTVAVAEDSDLPRLLEALQQTHIGMCVHSPLWRKTPIFRA